MSLRPFYGDWRTLIHNQVLTYVYTYDCDHEKRVLMTIFLKQRNNVIKLWRLHCSIAAVLFLSTRVYSLLTANSLCKRDICFLGGGGYLFLFFCVFTIMYWVWVLSVIGKMYRDHFNIYNTDYIATCKQKTR